MPRVATSTLRSASTAQSWNDRRRAAEFTELDPAVVDLRAGPLKAKVNLPGIKKLLLPRPADTASLDTSVPARALFGPPPETAVAEKRSSLVDFLKQVTLFEDLSRWDLRRLARIVLDGLVEQAVPGGDHGARLCLGQTLCRGDHRDRHGSRDHAAVQGLEQAQSLLFGTAGDKRDLQQNQVIRIVEPQERPRVKELPRRQDVNDLEEIVRWNPQCAHQTMLNRVRDLAETSLGIASFEDMDLREGHVESPLLIVTLSRSTCAISGFSCLLGRLPTSVGFTRRMDMACMNMYPHTRLMRSGI